ncbi:MAG: ribosome silencing factor [Bacilli bacterium]|nr:ribosome silencing factor [Bacilli bacterium]
MGIKKLERVVKSIYETGGNDIVVIDVRKVNPLCNYYVICDANNITLTNSIAQNLERDLKSFNILINHIEGRIGREWVLIDIDDVVVHVFLTPEREKYSLEKLWADQPLIDIKEVISNYE